LEEDFLDYFLSPLYEKHFSPDGKRINTAIQQLEKKELKKNQASPNKRDVLNIKDKYIMEEENRLEEPLSNASMSTLNTHYGALTNREEMWILEDRRLLFATKTDIATQEWTEVLDSVVNDKVSNLCN
jgi:lipase chaperone LimK